MKTNVKQFLIAMLIRAVRTFAQSFVAFIGVGAAFSEIDWLKALSVSGVSFILSCLTSVATGLPEVDPEPAKEEAEEK